MFEITIPEDEKEVKINGHYYCFYNNGATLYLRYDNRKNAIQVPGGVL